MSNEQISDESVLEEQQAAVHSKVPLHVRFWLSLKMGVVGKLLPVWAVSLVLSLFVVFMLESILAEPTEPIITPWGVGFYITIIVSFICMYLNSAIGMGYGITLIPIMYLTMGIEPQVVVPTILVTQFLAEFAAGISHQSAGNVDLSKESPHLKVLMVLAGCGIIGASLGVVLIVSISEPIATLAIGAIVTIIGIVIFATMGRRFRFSWRKIVLVGVIASLIKGFSGGGYGPIVTGGQILCGVGGKQAIGIKSIAEGMTCLVAVMVFLASGVVHDMTLGYPLVLGAICSVPFSAYTVRALGTKKVTSLIGYITLFLGVAMVLKAWIMLKGFEF